MAEQMETKEALAFSDEHCTMTVRRLGPGAVLVEIRGYDRGLLGLAPLDEVAKEMGRYPPVALFVDAAEAEGATWAVSQQWTRWFQANRDRLARVAILVRSRYVRQTVAVARELSRTGRLIEIYDDADRFAHAVRQEAEGRGRRAPKTP